MLWKLERDDIESSGHVRITDLASVGLTEKHLEDFLRHQLSEVVSDEHLMLLGQERAFQEEADLLALDQDGNLYIFELKRWESRPENLLQLLRYGQKFGRYTYSELEKLAQRSGDLGMHERLAEAHAREFEIAPLSEPSFNQDQVFVLITDGTDEDTISAVDYWSSKGLNVVCMPYRVYFIEGDPYLLLQPYNPTGAATVERERQFFVVNTNRRVDGAWASMIGDCRHGKAAAYYDAKWGIRRIPKDSTVFLYHTGTGIIAKGEATSGFQTTRFEGIDEAEFYVPLRFKWALQQDRWEQAPTAREVNLELGTGHRFRQTVMHVGEHMATAIDKIATEKGVRMTTK